MSQSRTIAVLLAVSALLCAGWTKTTHWHVPGHSSGHFSGHSHEHSSSQTTNAGGDCCSGETLATDCHATVEAEPALGDIPAVKSDRSHDEGHCSVCDFLAGHVYGLAMVFEYAGRLAACQFLPELLSDALTSQQRWVHVADRLWSPDDLQGCGSAPSLLSSSDLIEDSGKASGVEFAERDGPELTGARV